MKSNRILVLLLAAAILYSCGGNKENQKTDSTKLEGNITISGAFALYPMAVKWAEEFQKLHPDVRIDISAGGAGKGMADVLAGMVDLAMFSKEVSDVEKEKGAWPLAVTKDAVVSTINAENPFAAKLKSKGFTKAIFTEIYNAGTKTTWESCLGEKGNSKISIFSRSDACGAADVWAKYLGTHQESLKGIGVFGDPGIAEAVKKDKLAIGYNNVCFAYDMKTRKKNQGIDVIPIDVNENGTIDPAESYYESLDSLMAAIKDGRYPSPPSRELYFVTKGKPTNPVLIAFLKWVLTEGRKYIEEAGFVILPEESAAKEMKKLSE